MARHHCGVIGLIAVEMDGEGADERVGSDLAVQAGDRVLLHGQQHAEDVAERALSPARCLGWDRFGTAAPGTAGRGYALVACLVLLRQRLQPAAKVSNACCVAASIWGLCPAWRCAFLRLLARPTTPPTVRLAPTLTA